MVEEHYPRLGFCKIEGVETAQYELLVESYQVRECYINQIIRNRLTNWSEIAPLLSILKNHLKTKNNGEN